MNFKRASVRSALNFKDGGKLLVEQNGRRFSSKTVAVAEKSDKKLSSETSPLDELVKTYSSEEIESVEQKLKIEKYERIKNISKMKPWHQNQINGYMTPSDQFKWQQERWALKERYAKYGDASGANPGVMWPTEKELEERKLEEKEWSPNLFDTVKQYNEKVKSEQKMREERIKELDENFKKYPKLMEEYLEKFREKQRSMDQSKNQRQAKIKEIQDYFGYAIDENDPRFQVKLAMKEEEEKTVSRLVRKKEKQAAMLEKIQAMTASLAAQLPDNPPETPKNDENQSLKSQN